MKLAILAAAVLAPIMFALRAGSAQDRGIQVLGQFQTFPKVSPRSTQASDAPRIRETCVWSGVGVPQEPPRWR